MGTGGVGPDGGMSPDSALRLRIVMQVRASGAWVLRGGWGGWGGWGGRISRGWSLGTPPLASCAKCFEW